MATISPSIDIHDIVSIKKAVAAGINIGGSQSPSRVVELPGELVVKYGRTVWRSEFLAMELIRQHTTIPTPVPLSYLSEEDNGATPRRLRKGYLVMSKLPGVRMIDVLSELDEASCSSLSEQLGKYIDQLRTLDAMGSWEMVGKKGHYHQGYFTLLPWSLQREIKSNPCSATCTGDFVDYFIKASPPAIVSDEERQRELDAFDPDRPSSFTHGDLVPDNIMVDMSVAQCPCITGIFDWELAGWYPYFWDYFRASSRRWHYKPEQWSNWAKIFSPCIESYVEEAKSFEMLLYWTYDGAFEMPSSSRWVTLLRIITTIATPVSCSFSSVQV